MIQWPCLIVTLLAVDTWMAALTCFGVGSALDGVPGTASAAGAGDSVRVEEVYPTASELPANLLRFYIYFSKPMRPEVVHSSIILVDQEGETVRDAFLPTQAGLWSGDRRRLTVVLNPGRVKSGLASRDAMGPALRAHRDYAIVIEAGAEAIDGTSIAESHAKTFRVVEPDHRPPDPSRWVLSNPRARSLEPLIVVLDEPLDHVSLAFRLRVVNGSGERIPGRVALEQHERRWVLTPETPWNSGPYSLRVADEVEDLAANRPGRPFEFVGRIETHDSPRLVPINMAPAVTGRPD